MDSLEDEETPGRFPLVPVALILGAVVLIAALALTTWGWLSNLKPTADSPEVTFAYDMGAHHAQAVEMAVKIRDRTTDPELRILAIDITLTQQAQLGMMQGWLAAWQQPFASPRPVMGGQGVMMGMATLEQVYALDTLPVAEAEVSFLRLMIRHHQGGVAMAKVVLGQTNRPEILQLANSIVISQQSEIAYMQDLLKKRGVAA
ncbi:MAG: hypothetical protein BGO39_16605 [Chloroflexi bacterium 54-19]|nr:MAG: hypothetical protein BGO39_16605 [Chloroflexi bacterium 54-19]